MAEKIKIYAKIKGKMYWLKPLGKRECQCGKCALKDRRCDNEKCKTSPCDALYYAMDRISDADYRIVEVQNG